MNRMTRREAVGTLITGSVVAALMDFPKGGEVMAEETPQTSNATLQLAPAYRGANQIKPLPFEASKLKGLSEKLITSHHQNNYGGAVKRLNQIQQQIGGLSKDAAPYQMGSLKREELIATNSMILHEFYFANLGGDGKAVRHPRSVGAGLSAHGHVSRRRLGLGHSELQPARERRAPLLGGGPYSQSCLGHATVGDGYVRARLPH